MPYRKHVTDGSAYHCRIYVPCTRKRCSSCGRCNLPLPPPIHDTQKHPTLSAHIIPISFTPGRLTLLIYQHLRLDGELGEKARVEIVTRVNRTPGAVACRLSKRKRKIFFFGGFFEFSGATFQFLFFLFAYNLETVSFPSKHCLQHEKKTKRNTSGPFLHNGWLH